MELKSIALICHNRIRGFLEVMFFLLLGVHYNNDQSEEDFEELTNNFCLILLLLR